MATPKFNRKSPTIKRILKEAAELSNTPSPEYTAAPLESDLFEWHFTFRGPPKSAFAEGIYHGRIVLPPTYPLAPPSFRFMTPSGRFEPNREICLSISGHHEETWQPAWGIRTAIVALRTFMETGASGQIGGLDTSDAVRTRLATESQAWRCVTCANTNREIMAECEERYKELEETNEGKAQKEVEVPAELRMGFRDDMEKAKANAQASTAGAGAVEEDAESAQLAEGFVQTVPEPLPQVGAMPSTSGSPLPPYPPPAPVQGVPTPTTRVPLPDPVRHTVATTVAAQRPRPVDLNAGVPPWIDYAIGALVILLVAMLLNILLR